MPGTVNGIGTTYYGRANVVVETSRCESCGQTAQLSSYDTRLWFVFFFIPLIPLGRFRLLRYCSACTRHRRVSVAEWQKLVDSTLRPLEERWRAGDVAAGLELAQAQIAFQQHAAARAHLDGLVAAHPESTDGHA